VSVAEGVDHVPGLEPSAQAGWQGAYDQLTAADRVTPLCAADLELLARAAYMLGQDDDYVRALERAYRSYLDADEPGSAIRCAFWIGHSWLFRGQSAPGFGWFARAERLLDPDADTVDRGYVLIGEMLGHLVKGDSPAALAVAVRVTEVGERFGDRDLVAIGMMEHGHALVRQGRSDEGVRLIDETMVAVTAGELSPIVAGIVYCNTIAFCRGAYELRRVREWTLALTRWCAGQPDMVAHKGVCLVHRAEMMTLGGDWTDALAELSRISESYTAGALNRLARGEAAYRDGEVRRLRGEFAKAEAAYQTANGLGREPQPGLALMRLAQGRGDAAAATIRRAVSESPRGLPRVALLPAYVRIMLAAGDTDAAAGACRELDEIAAQQGTEAIDALASHARGAHALATGDAQGALSAARRACVLWQQLEAPYESARSRALLGRACRLLGDEDTAAMELRAARDTFTGLGARPDLAETEPPGDAHGLSPRELEVLRLVAAGHGNREIAAALVLSEHTVARHLQNIFAKIDVSTRAAAGAFAHEHNLA